MSEVATASPYKKEYVPGYTGHVPSKMEDLATPQVKSRGKFL